MDCKIIYKDNNRVGVIGLDGKPSETFQEILNNGQVKDFDEALSIYKNLYSDNIRYSIIGEKGASRIEEYKKSLDEAKKLDEQGVDTDIIEKQTGWYKNSESQWKMFSNDYLESFKTKVLKPTDVNKELKLTDVLEDSIIFDIYPEYKDINVVIYDKTYKNFRGGLDKINGGIGQKEGRTYIYARIDNPDGKSVENILGHELTHKNQSIEGFASGGDPNSILIQANNIINFKGDPRDAKNYLENYDKSTLNKNDKKIVEGAIEVLKVNTKEALTKSYMLLRGEVEARSVEMALKLRKRYSLETVTYSELIQALANEEDINLNQVFDLFISDTNNDISKEPTLQYQNEQGQTFNSYAEALKATDSGKISIGVNTLKGFKELANIDVNTNTNTIEGTINALVKANLLTGKKTAENTFETVGNDSARKIMSAEVIKEEVRKIHGVKSAFTTADGNIKIQKTAKEITKKDGTKISIEELDKLSYSELKANFEDHIAILAVRDAKNAIQNKEEREETQFTPENVLQEKLMSLLKKFGIQTMDFQDYVEKFKLKNGVEPSASALADIAHKIVAFRDGIITTEDLSEEVAHFIVASTPIAEKENMLRNVHRTQEWMEFSETYREIYGKTMSGEQLENAVREEILGKVLANGLISRFQAGENTTQTQQSILNKLADILKQFFDKIAGYIQDRYKKELADYSEDIYNNLMLETLELDTKAFDNYKFNMYSATGARSSKAKTILDATSEILTLLKNQEFKLYKGSQPNRAKLQELQDAIDNADKINSSANAIVISQKQIDYLTRAVNKDRTGFPLTQEELAVYETFKNQTAPLLSQISDLIGGNTKEERKLQEEVKKALGDFATIEGKVQNKEGIVIDLLIQRVIEKHKLSEKDAQKYREVIETFKGDTNGLHAHLGTLTNARNPLLNIAADVISRFHIQGRDYALPDNKALARVLEDNGLSPKDIQKLFKDGYLIDNVDYAKYDETVNQIKLEAYNRIAQKTLEVKDFIKLEKEGIEWENPDQRKEYQKEIADKTKDFRVNFFTDDFLKDQEEAFKDVAEEALDYHRRDRAERGDIRSGATQPDGTVVYDNNDTFRLRELNADRARKASPYSNGILKDGLIPIWNSEARKMEFDLADNASVEAKIAHGLQIIAKVQKESFPAGEEKAIPQKFYDYINQLVTNKEKLDFIYNNAYVGFTDEFWNSFGSDETLLEKLRNAGEDGLVDEITKQQQIKAEILKANRKYNSPSETLVGTTMSKSERDAIKLAEEELEILYADARKILNEEQSEEEQEKAYTQATNEAYKQDLEDEESDELEFIKKHTTSRNRVAIDRFARVARDKTAEIKGNYRNFLSEEMDDVQREEAIISFAKSRLLPYYKRTEPIGFTELMNSENIVYDILNSPLLQVSPNFSFYESQANDNVNPKFLENKAQGKPQIREDLFSNQYFKETFGEIVNGKPQKNQALWNVREVFLQVQRNTLENAGVLGKANLFQVPQVGKRGLRQFVDVVSKRNKGVVKEMMKDFLEYREDEQEFGAGNGVVPRYYLNKLENQEDVSDDYLYSYALMSQQAGLYRAKVENIGDMLSVKQALLKQDFKGKSAEASNAYKMFKSYMDNNFYGIRETFELQVDVFGHKIDVGALAKRFYKWVQKVNLAGFVVPVTSLLQGSVTKRIETTIGETINSTASELANKEFIKLSPGASGEMLKLNSKSRLNILLEWTGTYDPVQNRFENSIYNKFTRGITKVASLTHDLANFPIIPRVALSVMKDYRYVNGQVLNRNQFLRQADKNGNPLYKKEDWTKYELLYDDIKTDTGVVTFDKASMAKKLGVSEEAIVDDIIKLTKESITNRTLVAIQRIDTQISEQEKSLMARDSIWAFFLQHSSWMILGTMQKFKSKQLNLNSGEWEEGNWVTAYNTLKSLVKKTDGLSYAEHVKKVWDDNRGDEMQRRNINRVGVEVAMVTTLAVLSQIVSGFLDDEEDPSYALQVSDYFLYRVTNEVTSSNLALPNAYVDKVKSPLSSLDRILDLTDILDVASGDIVERGKYAGMTERQRWLVRNMPFIKDGNKLYNIDKEMKTYKFNNEDNEKWNILYYNLLKNAEE